MNAKQCEIQQMMLDFAVRIIKLKRYLNTEKHEFNIADQIQRSSSSIGAMYSEAVYAESKTDYIHKLCIAQKETNETEKVTIGGRFCESGDILIKEFEAPEIDEGDLLCVYNTGAYNYSMASNYNRVEKSAMVLVKDGKSDIIIDRQTLEQLVQSDKIPDRLK